MDHTHTTEDEIFYVVKGAVTFRCDGQTFDVEAGGFVFLPQGIEHGYTTRSAGDVQLLVVTAPAGDAAIGGWDGFVADLEKSGQLRDSPAGT